MEKKEKRKRTFVICIISQSFSVKHDSVLSNDADLLFLVDVFQPLSACRVHSVENEGDLKLQNAITVLATVHPQVWLHVALLIPRHVFWSFFVSFSR
jgi:hypothetical protein